MNYYVTRYALTQGIWEIPPERVEPSDDGNYFYIRTSGSSLWSLPIQIKKQDVFTDIEGANARVREMVETKMKSLNKALAKMKSFSPAVIRP